MTKTIHDLGLILRWQTLRQRIRTANGFDRLGLLRRFGDEVRAVMAAFPETMGQHGPVVDSPEIIATQGAVIGAWLSLHPGNPTWPGRDRLFLSSAGDLRAICATLATLGFFSPERGAQFACGAERPVSIPGIEAAGAATGELPGLIWESAVESARSKKRWRDAMASRHDCAWAEPWWRESPAVWRTCVLLHAADAVTRECRALPARGGDAPAGLVAFVKTPRSEAHAQADEWETAGWTAAVINRGDYLTLYDLLITAVMDKPLAVVLGSGSAVSGRFFPTATQRGDDNLLGKMSDEQFEALIGESLDLL